jgi:hypothetical protein
MLKGDEKAMIHCCRWPKMSWWKFLGLEHTSFHGVQEKGRGNTPILLPGLTTHDALLQLEILPSI